MSDVDTSRDRVEGLARLHDIAAQSYGDDNDAGLIALASTTAATLRALLAERDAARAQVAIERDTVHTLTVDVAAAFARGAEAMRERAAEDTDCGCAWRAEVMDQLAKHGERRARGVCALSDACLALQAAAIRALPLPGPEDKR